MSTTRLDPAPRHETLPGDEVDVLAFTQQREDWPWKLSHISNRVYDSSAVKDFGNDKVAAEAS